MNWVGVKSRMLTAIAYDHDRHHLYAEYRSGEIYCYREVPIQQYEELLAADSKGKYFRRHILKRYSYERIHRAFPTAS